MPAPGGFPYWTLLASLAGAAVLVAGPAPPNGGAREATARPRWQPLDAALLLPLVGRALTLRLLFLDGRVVDNDEPVSLGLTSLDAWARETDARLHPPLPALLMALASRGAMDLDAARGVSVLAGVATVALAFGVARRSGRGSGLFAGLLLAAMPAALHTSQLARGYALAALFVLAFHAALSRALDRATERWWLLATACAAAAAWSEYIAAVPVALDALVALWCVRRDRRRSVGIVTSLLGAAALCSPLLPFASRFRGVGGGDHPATGALLALGDSVSLLSGAAPRVLGALALLVAIGWARERDSMRRATAIVGVLALATIGATFTAARARYVLDMVPLFAVTLATSLAALGVPAPSAARCGGDRGAPRLGARVLCRGAGGDGDIHRPTRAAHRGRGAGGAPPADCSRALLCSGGTELAPRSRVPGPTSQAGLPRDHLCAQRRTFVHRGPGRRSSH